MKSSSDILAAALIPVAIALVAGAQQSLLRRRSASPDTKRKALSCDVYRASWTSGALGLAMFGLAGLSIAIPILSPNPGRAAYYIFCGLAIPFIALGVHSIRGVFHASVRFGEDRVEVRDGSRIQTVRYNELTSVAIASWQIVCGRSEGKPLRIPTIFKGNALILARLQSILERMPNKPLHGTPAKASSSSTEPEGRRP